MIPVEVGDMRWLGIAALLFLVATVPSVVTAEPASGGRPPVCAELGPNPDANVNVSYCLKLAQGIVDRLTSGGPG